MINVVAGILENDGFVFIARRPAHKHLGGHWEFPGGKVEQDETLEECLVREFQEEFNIQISIKGKFIDTTYSYPNIKIHLHSYLIQAQCDLAEIHAAEHDAISWVQIENLPQYQLAPADLPIAEELKLRFR